jgi:hypothetical protein
MKLFELKIQALKTFGCTFFMNQKERLIWIPRKPVWLSSLVCAVVITAKPFILF